MSSVRSSVRVFTEYAYDSNTGELLSVDYSDSTPDVSFTYDRIGRNATTTHVTGTRTYAYDAANLQLETETLPSAYFGGRILTQTYQGSGSGLLPGRAAGYKLGTSGTPDQDLEVEYGYDVKGRVETVASGAGAYTYGYVSNSDLLSGVAGPVATTTYAYEANRDVKTVVWNKVRSTTISKYTYQYDALGRRSSRAQEGTAFAASNYDRFAYNDRNEVVGSKNYAGTNPASYATDTETTGLRRAYAFDPIGNRLSSQEGTSTARAYTSNALNQYTAMTNPSASPTHDLDGNQLVSGTGWYYEWDGENRLALARDYASSPSSGSKKVEFVYDFQSRRVRKVSSTYSSGSWAVDEDRKFVYQGWNLLGQFSTSGFTAIDTYTWGLDLGQTFTGAGGVGGVLGASLASPTSVYHALADANGNITSYVDGSGDIEASFEYDAFGSIIGSSGSSLGRFPFRFSSKFEDAGLGVCDYGFRYYSPLTGRWLSRDPMKEAGHDVLYNVVSLKAAPSWQDSPGLELLQADITLVDEVRSPDDNAYTGMLNNQIYYVDPDGRNPTAILRLIIKELAKLEAKRRAKRTAECAAIYSAYKAQEGSCRACRQTTPAQEAAANFACWSAVVAGRALYIAKKCDYYLPGSIAAGSSAKEVSHKRELAKISMVAADCLTCVRDRERKPPAP